jgi:hypothetical protein
LVIYKQVDGMPLIKEVVYLQSKIESLVFLVTRMISGNRLVTLQDLSQL